MTAMISSNINVNDNSEENKRINMMKEWNNEQLIKWWIIMIIIIMTMCNENDMAKWMK